MSVKMPFVSYTLATVSGIFFLSGLVILAKEGRPIYG